MHFETLETRSMMSVTPVNLGAIATVPTSGVRASPTADPNLNVQNATRLVNGVLYVTGTSNPDSLRVISSFIIGPTSLPLTRGSLPSLTPAIQVSRNGVIDKFPTSQVSRIVLDGYVGGDVLSIEAAITTPATIIGTDGDDFIQSGNGNDVIDAGAGNDNIFGQGGNDNIYAGAGANKVSGGEGDDTIVGGDSADILDGGNGADTIKGQGGNDQIFAGGGADNVFGGNGDDTIVSVFGGKDIVHGDAGWDIIVADRTDTIADADALENARGSIYRIDRFTNPTLGGAHPVFATDLGATNISEPALTSAATKYQDFSNTQLFTSMGPKLMDVQQNQVNDCWFAATAGGVAESTPWVIKRSVVALGDGTYFVALGQNAYRVDGRLAVNDKGTPVYGNPNRPNGQSLWFPLMEKALAYFISGANSPKYSDIVANTPDVAFDALRVSNDYHTLVSVFGIGTDVDEMWQEIISHRGKAIVFGTEPSWLGVDSKLVATHAYTVVDTYSIGTQRMVVLRNPWAYNQNDNSNDGRVTVTAESLYDSCSRMYFAN